MSQQNKKDPEKKRPTLWQALFAKPERDSEYMTDLNTQWSQLDNPGRVRFVIGAVLAAILFFAALGAVLWVIGRIMG